MLAGCGRWASTRAWLFGCALGLGAVLAGCSSDVATPSPDESVAPPAGAPSTGGGALPAAGAAGGTSEGGSSAIAGAAGAGGTTGGSPSAGEGGAISSPGGGEAGQAAVAGASSQGGGGAGQAGGATGGNGGAGGGSVENLEATMVVRGAGTATAGDKVMIARLEAYGFSKVTVISDAQVTADSVSGQDLVVISSSAESGPLKDKLKTVAVPVLCIEDAEFKLMAMATSAGHDAGKSQLQIASEASALVGTASGTVTFATEPGELGWGTPAASALKGATMVGNPERVVIFGYEKGAQMVNMVAPARRAGFAIREDLAANLNPDGVKLFDAILAWVMK